MKSTRSGKTFSPYGESVHVSADIERLLDRAFEREEFVTETGSLDAVGTDQESNADVMDDEDTVAEQNEDNQYAMAAALTSSISKKAEKDKKRRQQKRKVATQAAFWKDGQPPNIDTFQRIMSEAQQVETLLQQGDIHNLPASSCGFQGKRDGLNRERRVKTYESLIEEGYRIVPWDGRTTKLLTCGEKRTIIAACVGRTDDDDWTSACNDAYDAFKEAREHFEQNGHHGKSNPRGMFASSLAGIIHGHGSTEPHNIRIKRGEDAVRMLMDRKSVIRLANFASASFKMFSPKVYAYYHERMKELDRYKPELKRPFTRSVFACAGFNMGPKVATYMHRDCMNCPHGWCSIQALGKFDSAKGGHIVFEDLKIAVEFPSGSLILLPSATLRHGNTPVQDGEDRASFTQFTPGNLFRYIDCGLQTEEHLKRTDFTRYEAMMEEKKSRWKKGIDLWSTMDDLIKLAQESAVDVFDT